MSFGWFHPSTIISLELHLWMFLSTCPSRVSVMSHNTHVTFADKLQLVPSCGTHYCHFHMTSKIPRTPIPHLNSDTIKSQPCSLFSISLTSCSCPSLHSCVSSSCIHCLAVFPLALLISTNALLPDPTYKTPAMYAI